MEDASIFAVSGYQYIFMAVVVTKGYPYKKPLYHNGNPDPDPNPDLTLTLMSLSWYTAEVSR